MKSFAFLLCLFTVAESRTVSRGELSITVSNPYTEQYGDSGLKYEWLEDKLLVELYQVATLTADYSGDDRYHFEWNIKLPISKTHVVLSGQTVDYTFTEEGVSSVALFVHDLTTGKIAHSMNVRTVFKYIRREIKDLNDKDRTAFLKAMEIIYNTDTTRGKKLYGDYFRDVVFYGGAHNDWAGGESCDHLHDGYGFMTQHVALSMMFEQSLRSINPATTLPYWEYTVEGNAFQKGGMELMEKSVIFSDDWFGPINNTNAHTDDAEGIVATGRFAHTRIPTVLNNDKLADSTEMDLVTHNSYNLMKSPWNGSPSQYLTRYPNMNGFNDFYDQVATCENLYKLMDKHTSFGKFAHDMEYFPHGSMHMLLGGMYAPGLKPTLLKAGWSEEILRYSGVYFFVTLKNLWRGGKLKFHDSCEVEQDDGTFKLETLTGCPRSCPNLETWLLEENLYSTYSSVFVWVDQAVDPTIKFAQLKVWTTMLRFVCDAMEDDHIDTRVYLGEMINSNAPFDPLFWPLHTTVQRYLEWRRWNGFTSNVWPDGSSLYGADCTGHDKSDILYFADILEARTNDSIRYTNLDLYNILLPDSEYTMLDTLFDKFEWPHCAEEGYPLAMIDTTDYTGI